MNRGWLYCLAISDTAPKLVGASGAGCWIWVHLSVLVWPASRPSKRAHANANALAAASFCIRACCASVCKGCRWCEFSRDVTKRTCIVRDGSALCLLRADLSWLRRRPCTESASRVSSHCHLAHHFVLRGWRRTRVYTDHTSVCMLHHKRSGMAGARRFSLAADACMHERAFIPGSEFLSSSWK